MNIYAGLGKKQSDALSAKLDRVEASMEALLNSIRGDLSAKLDSILGKVNMAVKTLDDVLAETTRGTTIETSMETLLKGLHDQVIAANGNQAAIDAIFNAVKTRNDDAAAAVVANTISAELPPPPAPATTAP